MTIPFVQCAARRRCRLSANCGQFIQLGREGSGAPGLLPNNPVTEHGSSILGKTLDGGATAFRYATISLAHTEAVAGFLCQRSQKQTSMNHAPCGTIEVVLAIAMICFPQS